MPVERFLAIKNLPHAPSLGLERVYAVVHDESAPVSAVAWATLLSFGEAGQAYWVTRDNARGELSSSTELAGRMRGALRADDVKAYRWGETAAPAPGTRALEELEYFGVSRGALVVIDGAERFFNGTGIEKPAAVIEAFQQWARRKECVLLLLCARGAGRIDPAVNIRPGADRLAGFARLRQSDEALWWDVFHWFGSEGAIAGRSFRLATQADGSVGFAEAESPAPLGPAADEEAVFITRAAAPSQKQHPPAAWHVADGFDALASAAAGATAATFILHFDQDTVLDTLNRAVFALRRERGARIKIVVREVAARLRYSQEQMLLRLGANLVVPAEVSFSRFPSLVATVQGQVYARPAEADYETAIAGAVPVPEQGYLAPRAFVQAASVAIDQAGDLAIESALVRLWPSRGLTPLDALRSCAMSRPGDLCTADGDSVYVLLFACRESDVGSTLGRLFCLPVPDLFEGEVRYLSPAAMRQTLEDLAGRAKRGEFPDLRGALAGIRRASFEPREQRQASGPDADRANPRPEAATATRQPLSLRLSRPVPVRLS